MPYLRTLLICSFAISGCILSAQSTGEAARLVRLNVVATAADLTAEDFKVTDDGKAQRIAIFRGPQSANTTAGEFSNRPAAPPHTTAILIDLLNQKLSADRIDSSRKIGQSLKQLDSGESATPPWRQFRRRGSSRRGPRRRSEHRQVGSSARIPRASGPRPGTHRQARLSSAAAPGWRPRGFGPHGIAVRCSGS